MIAGVCNGVAAYFGIDPTFVRLGFVLLAIFWGTGLLVYVVMAFVVPEAKSAEQKAAATGFPETAQEFIRRAKAGYYEAMKNFPDRKARRMWRREWKRQFKREMRANAHVWWGGWQAHCATRPPMHPGAALAMPVLSVFQGALLVLWLCALISLLSRGSILGFALPENVPVWAAALILCFLYGVVAGPIKMARKSFVWGTCRPGPGWALFSVMDAAIWIVFALALAYLSLHFYPELKNAVQSIPGTIHQAGQDIHGWWHGE